MVGKASGEIVIDLGDWGVGCLEAWVAAGHKPELDDNGNADEWAYYRESYHSGYKCTECGRGICLWCYVEGDKIRKCGGKPKRRSGLAKH